MNTLRSLSLCLVAGSALVAQQATGSLNIQIKDQKGQAITGAKVNLTSPALQGARTGATDANGTYRGVLLPPGQYRGTISKDGFLTVSVTATVVLGGNHDISAVMKPIEVAGTVVEVVATSSKLSKETVTVSENISQEELTELLPIGRGLTNIVAMAPGVVTGPGGRPTFSGSEGYESKYLVEGVDVNDNLFNQPRNLFIEDAILETQVIMNNVSAEYGRFTGGVVNAITKTGGNNMEGIFRLTGTNAGWNAVKPMQRKQDIVSKFNPIYTLTVGGPIVKDKLWYFISARQEKTSGSENLPTSNIANTFTEDEKRYGLSVKYAISQDHILSATYNWRTRYATGLQPLTGATADPKALYGRDDVDSLISVRYQAIFGAQANLEVLGTRKLQKFLNFGSSGSAFENSPVRQKNSPVGRLWNNRYFGMEPEYRNNFSLAPKLSLYFEGLGTHDLRIGGEIFEEWRRTPNQQSPTGVVLWADVAYTGGVVNYTFKPGSLGSGSEMYDWIAPGGTLTSRYSSLYIQDNWKVNANWNLALGLRYEHSKHTWDEKNQNLLSMGELAPRLGINYDPKGDGKTQFSASYALFFGKVPQNRVAATTYVGNPALYIYDYKGAAYSTATLTGEGFSRAGYSNTAYYASDPTKNTLFNNNLKYPRTSEQTLMVRRALDNGSLTLQYISRLYTRNMEDYMGDYGTTSINGTNFYNIYWTNADDNIFRRYEGLQATWDMRGDSWMWHANYTFSKNRGNYDSEGGNAVGGGTENGNFELARPGQNPGIGFLSTDRTHLFKARFGKIWHLGKDQVNLGMNFEYGTGAPYSHTLPSRPSTQGVYGPVGVGSYTQYFSQRGAFRLPDYWSLDASSQYDGHFTQKVGYFAKLTVFNVLNRPLLTNFFTGGTAATVGTATTWSPSASYGKPTSSGDYSGSRRIQIDFGIKF